MTASSRLLNRLIWCVVYQSEQLLDQHIWYERMLYQIHSIAYGSSIIMLMYKPAGQYIHYNACIKVFRSMIVYCIVQFDTDIMIITSREYGSMLEVYQSSHWNTANIPNSSEICISEMFDFVAFQRQLYSVHDIFAFYSISSRAFRGTSKVVSE